MLGKEAGRGARMGQGFGLMRIKNAGIAADGYEKEMREEEMFKSQTNFSHQIFLHPTSPMSNGVH